MTEGMVNIKKKYSPPPDWYWKVRIYAPSGQYAFGQIRTARDLRYIDRIQDFYLELTGCKMLREGMGEQPFENVAGIDEAFDVLWKNKRD
jgi:hypothetical protein